MRNPHVARDFRRQLARALGFVECVAPGAMQPQQLGPPNETRSAKRDDTWLRIAPDLERLRPFLRTAQIEYVMTGADHAAVHGARDDRTGFPVRDRDHHLVEQRKSFRGLAHREKRAALPMAGEHDQIAIVELRPEVAGLTEGSQRARDVALSDVLTSSPTEQPTVFHAWLGSRVEQPARAGEPAGRLRLLAGVIGHGKRNPACAARRASVFPALETRAICSRPCLYRC